MRKAFTEYVLKEWNAPDHVFLTGDLGFNALEAVRDAFGERFINCGIAEQNMVSVAAALAMEGFKCLVYSIAPFVYARPFEQVRNDLGLTGLPVCLVGNGGGYAYGVLGPTHHALEDCASLSAIGVRCLVPACGRDIGPMVAGVDSPAYLRLGRETFPEGVALPPYAPWRKLLEGQGGVCVALGPMAGLAWRTLSPMPEKKRPALWCCTELTLSVFPEALAETADKMPFYVLEEHVREGGLGMAICTALAEKGVTPFSFVHRHALRYPSGRYGSQKFHLAECGLDGESLGRLFLEGGLHAGI